MSGSHSVAEPSMVFPCWNLLIEPSSTYALIKNTMSHGEYLRTISGCQPKKCYFLHWSQTRTRNSNFLLDTGTVRACTSMLEPSLYLIVTWYLKFKQVNRNKRQPQVILLLYKLSCFDDVRKFCKPAMFDQSLFTDTLSKVKYQNFLYFPSIFNLSHRHIRF